MKLTGKAKGQFEKWILRDPLSDWFKYDDEICYAGLGLIEFHDLPNSMQWGVYQDWADSLGYELYVEKISPVEFDWCVDSLLRNIYDGRCKTRQEARTAAIEKLNELINEKA